MGTVRQIFIATKGGADMSSLADAELLAEQGLTGDRYAGPHNAATPERQVTLIEAEHIQGFVRETGLALAEHAMRRNIVTENVALNAFCGQRFAIGPVLLEGIELCEPCAGLARSTYPEVLKYFVHRGGLRARVLSSGRIAVGDAIALVSS